MEQYTHTQLSPRTSPRLSTRQQHHCSCGSTAPSRWVHTMAMLPLRSSPVCAFSNLLFVFDMDYPPRSFPTFCSILSLQPFYSALVIKTYPTNLQGSFLLFILRPQIRFLFLSATLFLHSQPIYPTYHFFHASNTHFLQPTLPFCHQLSSTNFLTYFIFFSSFNHLPPQFTNQFSQTIFFSNHFHQPATINSARSFFLATVLPTNNHHCHLIVI